MRINNSAIRLLIIIFAISLIHIPAFSQDYTLMITVKNARNNKGVLRITLFRNEGDYMTNFSINKIVPAKTEEVTVTFEHLPVGEYAVTVMHDENNNNKLDSNFIRIPKEGTGFSNDAAATFGPPSWEKAKFKWTGDSKPRTISLKYF